MARKGGRDRGIFQDKNDPKIWWVRYTDQCGKDHKGKIGRKALAKKVYERRKTEASQLVMNGVALYEVSKLLGHKNIKTTERYSHLAPGYLKKAVATLVSVPAKPINGDRRMPKGRNGSSDFGSGSTVNSGELA